MKNKFEQNLERREKMKYEFLVKVHPSEKNHFATTCASSLPEAQRNILHRKKEFKQQGIILKFMDDVKKLYFKNNGEVEPKKEKIFWWQEN